VLFSDDESQHLCRDIECPAVKTPPLSVFRVKLMGAVGRPFFVPVDPAASPMSGNS